MHEIGMLYQAADLAIKYADENNADDVKYITFEIGELSGALPHVFTEYFPMVAEKYPKLKNAEIKIREVSGEGLCSECSCLYNVMRQEGTCPRCGSKNKKILGGQDVKVINIGI